MTEPKAAPFRPAHFLPPDQAERSRSLDPTRSFLVQAPAGSGKTYLLTQRFLKLLAQVEKPDEIVAITFTNAAAAEMRNRILDALEKAEGSPYTGDDLECLPALATGALAQSKRQGWQILDQPSQLRITTIDAFCRSLALQSPLSWGILSGLGGSLDMFENPDALYRRAARRTLDLLSTEDSPARRAIEEVLLWRDNNWRDVEDLVVEMLAGRNRWYQDFVFARNENWEALRKRLEAPFQRAARRRLESLWRFLDELPGFIEFALSLARFACETPGKQSPLSLAERADLPIAFTTDEETDEALFLEDALEAYRCLACFLLTKDGVWRKKGGLNVHGGFPATPAGKTGKERFGAFVESLAEIPGLHSTLAAFKEPMPLRYTEDEWRLVQHCFTVLRNAAVELQMVFAETGSVDFIEVAQIALRILAPENGFPSDFAIRQADSIRHLLIDEFQDTSRNQHQLLARLIAAWPEREGRSCFCVGDPMQSIYGFRDAEVELFERLKTHGLDTSSDPFSEPFQFEFISLRANFRTVPSLVTDLNGHFEQIFAEDDGSGVRFSLSEAARESQSSATTELHLAFTRSGHADAPGFEDCNPELTRQAQLDEMVALIQNKLDQAKNSARLRNDLDSQAAPEKLRIAVLGRTRSSLVRVAEALHAAGISFRAIDLVKLRERPEVLDALSLARALLNPIDRTAWLGVLRAPWCGLTLAELHLLTSADDRKITATPIPQLLASRLHELYAQDLLDQRAFSAASRVQQVLQTAVERRSSAATVSLGTWLESVWKALGGADTANSEKQENLRLLWAALDKMPEGEIDLLGPGLHAALDELFALPAPAASSDFGVQLMTIHKSKGLEFEVVIVPDIDAGSRNSTPAMISWLERGLPAPEAGDQLTEFLIAPIQSKGTDAGAAKLWVDRVKRARETQELRRVLYVAATRAREELHLFVRPRFKVDPTSGEPELAKPAGLLATAWPAVAERIEQSFAALVSEMAETPAEIESLAAQASSLGDSGNLLEMPQPSQPARKPALMRRLPALYAAPAFPREAPSPSNRGNSVGLERAGLDFDEEDSERTTYLDPNEESSLSARTYTRTTGGLRSRILGSAIHAFLERLSHLRTDLSPSQAAEALSSSLSGVAAEIRRRGLPRVEAERLAREALAIAQQAATHPVGAWILAPHPNADVEVRWTGLSDATKGQSVLRNLRPDRVFFAPPAQMDEPASDASWWIIEYKTAHASGANLSDSAERERFLRTHREQHAGQLAAYAQVLRGLREQDAGQKKKSGLKIIAGIFYPRLGLLDHWEV